MVVTLLDWTCGAIRAVVSLFFMFARLRALVGSEADDRGTGMKSNSNDGRSTDKETVLREIRSALMDMEDDLRILHGGLASLRLMGWSNQPADPEALAFLSRFTDEAFDRLKAKWAALADKTRSAAQ